MKRFVISMVFLLVSPALCLAQTAQITGVVKDASDAGIPNTRLVVTNIDTEVSRQTVSGEVGNYIVPLLPPGRYRTSPPLFTFANVRRVLPDVRAPGLVQLDFGLQKYIALTERVRLHLRGEAFDATNRVNLGPPDVTFTAAAFGTINSTSTPARVMQFGAKVIF